MRPKLSNSFSMLALAGLLAAAAAAGQHHAHPKGESLGHVEFPVTCAGVQVDFNLAAAYLHSFEYEDARISFERVAAKSPGCAMAWWGVAMTYYHPLWAPPSPADIAAGGAAAEKAASLTPGNERERLYVAAIGAFYKDAAKKSHMERAAAYRDGMAKLAAAFPKEGEAQIFYALALMGSAPIHDRSYAQQKQAAEILNGLVTQHPDHPGILHYVIHAFDYPELASLALPAARAYSKVAPDSPHALHMPSHIFIRLGLWDEAIASNIDSAAAGRAQAARLHPGTASQHALHALDYLEYAYLQLGQEEKARAAVDEAAQAVRFDGLEIAVPYALAAIPARWALERHDWRAAASLEPPKADLPWDRFPFVGALTAFANTVGAARAGDPAHARAALARLEQIEKVVAGMPRGGPYDWAGHVESLRLGAAGWVAFAEGRRKEAERQLRAAAEREDAVGKHPVTPGSLLPARELYADLLFELGRPREALAAYEASLSQTPGRFHSVAGAARSAERAGDAAAAARYAADLAKLCPSPCRRLEAARPQART